MLIEGSHATIVVTLTLYFQFYQSSVNFAEFVEKVFLVSIEHESLPNEIFNVWLKLDYGGRLLEFLFYHFNIFNFLN
jgi:hypothetical protein